MCHIYKIKNHPEEEIIVNILIRAKINFTGNAKIEVKMEVTYFFRVCQHFRITANLGIWICKKQYDTN